MWELLAKESIGGLSFLPLRGSSTVDIDVYMDHIRATFIHLVTPHHEDRWRWFAAKLSPDNEFRHLQGNQK